MQKILAITTQPDDSMTNVVLAAERTIPDAEVQVRDLASAEPGYRALLEEIFAADAVQVW